ncbi:Crp/Fnr family transcriptional regulator [Pseudomaricurvus alkylphenolicus]|uniref:Crp/Fnr family transcriptional regulator n=1 Tax=Pseudomaricurvus alkylphenolicus TaxID=1306991 RepID=UPI00141FE5C5|nr:Crp/Fnr family transcriptional regulator [Pseudomaricurvus alkylphenolicus]NIB41583.1 Crp/Fnr family transcriptional regulator [Pseudomaricurvus alkylphenolicus]
MIGNFSRARHIWMDKLPPHLQQALRKKMKILHLKDKDILLQQGGHPEGIYELQEGRIKAYVTASDGKQVSLNIFSPRVLLGEANVLTDTPFAQSAQAMGDTLLGFLSTACFNEMREKHPEIDKVLLQNFSHKLIWMNDYMISVATKDLEARLAGRLCRLLMRDKSVDEATMDQSHVLDCTQEDLAELIGTTRQSINKVLRAWEEEGIVGSQYRSLVVNDLARLESIAEGR